MKELQPNILADFEHVITRAIDRYSSEPDFPDMVAMEIERKELEDYLYEYQRILDSEGSQKAQLTKYGIVAVIPILILSAFPESMLPWGKYSLIAGIAIGVLLALLWKGISMLVVRMRLRKLRAENANLAQYVIKVDEYQKEKSNQ